MKTGLKQFGQTVAVILLTAVGTTSGKASQPSPPTGSRPTTAAAPDVAATHWSFQPIRRPPLPPTGQTVRNPIDRFILAKLDAQHLAPAPEASRRLLIRRLSFDLIGLPPSPEETRAFETDPRPDAYERLVDRLLASPLHGERWARHWLDVVRFAETHGFEMNNPRPNAWPYRDYVIRAFNEDRPYDRFVREQLAGDTLGSDEATGFLVAGPWDQVKSPDEVLTRNQRADELHDMVSTVGSALLGLTIGCARCHDHKFDPIPQTDYYALKAVLEGVQHGERERAIEDSASREQDLAAARRRLAELDQALLRFEPLAASPGDTLSKKRPAVHPRRNVERFAPIIARRLRFTILETDGNAEPCVDELEVFSTGSPATNIALARLGTRATASGTFANSDLHRLEHLNDGRYGNSRSWISNQRGQAWVELEFATAQSIDHVVWARDQEAAFADRLPVRYELRVEDDAGRQTIVASAADREPFVAGRPYRSGAEASLDPAAATLLEERKQTESRIRDLTRSTSIYAGSFRQPDPTRRFSRGDPMQPREPIAAGTLSRIGNPGSRISLDLAAPERDRRRALADWIASANHPLTARVIVNRLWQHHFAEGLVNTPSDFGINGARPSHPELLDWMAAELVENGWSLKHLHRLIVCSAAYRQTSETDTKLTAAGMAADAGDRLLWRYPAHRLDAEPLRDSILAACGTLDLTRGGPGWSAFVPNENYVRVYVPKETFQPADFRRMVYMTAIRQRPDGVFGVFDCPDGGQIAPRRNRSTTPLQSLNLLNSGFTVQTAALFAARLEREAGSDSGPQVLRAFQLAFNREPDADEAIAARNLIQRHGLTVFCRALLNANEFAFVF